jgi:hypothetical protein
MIKTKHSSSSMVGLYQMVIQYKKDEEEAAAAAMAKKSSRRKFLSSTLAAFDGNKSARPNDYWDVSSATHDELKILLKIFRGERCGTTTKTE